MIQSFKEVYLKNLNSLLTEISLYNSEEDIWRVEPGILNSAGNLTLHLMGNLNFFIGTYLGDTGYVRDRDREFADKDIPKQQLINDLNETINMLDVTLSNLTDEALLKVYPTDKFGEGKTNAYILTYLLAHFNYHLGQINYHRRLLSK